MAGSREGFRWTVGVLSAAFVLGGYVDAWSRLIPSSPVGPWHDAFVDGAWLAVTGFMAAVLGRDLARGVAWRAALPTGYHLALAGGLVFGLGALADVYYQIAFGVGQGLEALLAPPHLVELAAGGLLVAAPLSQALRAGLAGFLVSYLAGIRRPRSVVAAEVWGERWPQRHIEVSPAAVKEALEALDDQAAICASPLTKLACIPGEGSAAGPELRGLLVDYYVKKVGSHEVIAERLHLSRPTFYRRLQRGLTLTAERLDELAEFAARHG